MSSGLTLRSLLLGLAQVLVVCLGAPYAIWVLGSSEITWSFFPISVGFFLVCLLFLNALIKSFSPPISTQTRRNYNRRRNGPRHHWYTHFHDGFRPIYTDDALLLGFC